MGTWNPTAASVPSWLRKSALPLSCRALAGAFYTYGALTARNEKPGSLAGFRKCLIFQDYLVGGTGIEPVTLAV